MNATLSTNCPNCRRWVPVEQGAHPEGTCPPPPVCATLPVTGAVVPAAAAALTVKITGEMKTYDGVAFTAEVRDGKRLRGVIEQDGRGGGTDFHHATYEDMVWFNSLVEDYQAISEDHQWVAHESLCNDLYEEVALARDFNRKRNAVLMLDGNRDEILMINAPLSDSVRAWARRTYGDRSPMVWVKKSGWAEA